MRTTLANIVGALLLLAGAQGHAANIPDRPEKLSFPPLTYDPPNPAEFRTPLKSGPVAYVAPDRELPLVTIHILVRTGRYLDPPGKDGLAGFTGFLLTHGGTESKTAEELEERLAFLAAQLSSSVGDDSGSVSLNLLSKDLPEGLTILREVLTAPRFQQDKLDLERQQSIQGMKQRNDDSSSIEAREAEYLAYGTNFWASRETTEKSVNAIHREDLQAFHHKWFHPGNFTVAVSGDFDRAEMIGKLETLFSNWPFQGDTPPPVPTNTAMAAPGIYVVNKDVNQGRVSVLLPGVKRDDPDYPAVLIMNDILGGGGFTARLMNRVRSDEGLAYGAYSSFPGGVNYPLAFHAGLQSKSGTVTYAAQIVMEEMTRMTSSEVTDEEINTAKRSFIDTFSETFNTKGKIAGQFAKDEFTGRFAKTPDFWKTWRTRVQGVAKGDVLRVAREKLHPDKVILLIVGQKDEILKGHPDHPVQVGQLTSGKLTELPLRDPLTLEPISGNPAAR
jgi:predicted Zn-dependent peptidase